MMWLTGSLDGLGAYLLAILARYCLDLAWLKLYSPHHMVLMGIRLPADSHRNTIDEEFNLVGIVIIGPEVNGLTREPVPMREEMEHRFAGPLALVHIVTILGEACQIDNAEVGTTCWETIRRRFTDIIETSPDELSTNIRRMLDHIPHLLVST